MKKKYWLIGIIVLVFAVATVGIAAQNPSKNGTPSQEGKVQYEESEETVENEKEKEKTALETAEGVFVGLADSNTAELEVEGHPTAFALDQGVATDELQNGDRISFQYKEDQNGRLVITQLNKRDKERKELEKHKAEGMLIGRIDNQSVEIEVGGQPKSFALSDELREKDFDSGEISFQYYVDNNGRSIITAADFREPWESEVHTAEVTFIGLADNHTAEIEMNGETKAFGLDDHISFTGIDTGEKIFIFYQENEQGRQEIIKIEKIL